MIYSPHTYFHDIRTTVAANTTVARNEKKKNKLLPNKRWKIVAAVIIIVRWIASRIQTERKVFHRTQNGGGAARVNLLHHMKQTGKVKCISFSRFRFLRLGIAFLHFVFSAFRTHCHRPIQGCIRAMSYYILSFGFNGQFILTAHERNFVHVQLGMLCVAERERESERDCFLLHANMRL